MTDFLALDEAVLRWETRLPDTQGAGRAHLLARLAWHLRQRDTGRAVLLTAEAQALMHLLPPRERHCFGARLMLVEAESCWLSGALDTAQALAGTALREFARVDDAAGRADARWLQAWIANDRGDVAATDAALTLAGQDAAAAGDPVRMDIFDAAAALFAVFRGLQAATERWGGRFPANLAGLDVARAGWISDYLGAAAFQAGDFGRAIGHLMVAFEAAMATGQRRRALLLAANIGNGFTSLNAHDAALEWMQRGLDIARATGWPLSIGVCQMQAAETLRQLGRFDGAHELLTEALARLAPVSASRAYAVALEYRGDLALDMGDYQAALENFRALRLRGEALGQADFCIGARRGEAQALARLARPAQALEAAFAALAQARVHGDPQNEIAALRVLADIHARQALPPPPGLEAPNAVLHYLRQALAVAATIDGYTVPAALLDEAAREYAAIGDHAQAYAIALQAGAARHKTHSQEATNRAIALHVQYQTERAQTEGEHHRQLAAAEARRATLLQEKNAELQQAYQALEEVSLTDQLTGLRNRRFFLRHVDADVALSLRRWEDALRSESPAAAPDQDLVFFLVDLDYFKEVNDRHGHAAGDAVLAQMQERLREVFRESDYLVRWGGEEFLVLARAIRRDEAGTVAERVRNAVAQRPFELPDGTRLARTCSIGFACFPFLPARPRALSWSQVVELADRALYIAKHSGRNGWAALYPTRALDVDDPHARMVDELAEAVAAGEVRIVTNLAGPLALTGAPAYVSALAAAIGTN